MHSLKVYLIRVRNLVVEVDARYIKGMLVNPDLAPSASRLATVWFPNLPNLVQT